MHKLSLISSLYRSEKHLPDYITRLEEVLAECRIPLEIVVVANDATSAELVMLKDLAQNKIVKILHCPRESLYASWNRGIAAATGDFIGFWNVDDKRTVEGLELGYRLLSEEAEIVDFAFEIQEEGKIRLAPPNYRPRSIKPRDTVAPFFLFRRSLFERAGTFNESFKIVGDYEWAAREVVRNANYIGSSVLGGRFILHESNLSGGRHPLEWVEFNLALIKLGAHELLRPVDPDLMFQAWQEWGRDYTKMSPALEKWFWGKGAKRRFQAYQNYRKSKWAKRLNLVLRRLRLAKENPFSPPKK
jgi:glycosyltransferase involved in cell wall biosynthesis